MKERACFLASILFAFLALVLHTVARDQIMKAVHRKAYGIREASRQHTKYVPDAEGLRLSHSGQSLNQLGLAFTGFALICLIAAVARQEPGWYSIPILLLIFAVGVRMLL